ncbi:MAG TPA: MmgE/PrpD family protein [Streptosporangiaceae bacterium]|nr:MmgE/PrpD family protein [Streptosporangiaceae bacterium]
MTDSPGLTIAQRLAEFAVASRYPSLPEPVGRSVRQRVLDIIGIAIAATPLASSGSVASYAAEQGGKPEAHAVGIPHALPAPLAALVNGTLAHSLDYDDTHLPSVLHPSATVVPAGLAAAEAAEATGAQAIAAIAAGLEICVRLGMAGYDQQARNSTYFDRGQHATSICGAIGAAATAALLGGLDADGVLHAMAIAVSMAGGVIEANRTGGTVKRMHCGWAAHAALTAAGLAARGMTGPPTVFEGRFGFFQAFLSGQYNADAIVGDLGERWEVPGIFFKPYPANHFTHAGIDAAMALRAKGVAIADVTHLQLGVAAPTVHTIGEPIDVKRAPQTGYQAQFSGPYTVVTALMGGGGLGVSLDDFTDQAAQDPARRAHLHKVEVVADPRCTELFPEQFPAVLTARLTDGSVIVEEVMHNRGGPGRPLSDADLDRKFNDNACRMLPPGNAANIKEAVARLDQLPSVSPCLLPATDGPS